MPKWALFAVLLSSVLPAVNWAGVVPVGAEFQVNSYTTDDQFQPTVAADPDSAAGGFVVAWSSRDQDGDDVGVFAQRYDGSGTRIGGEFQVNTYTTGEQTYTAASVDRSGNFIVVWEGPGNGDSEGVFARRYDVSGSAVGGEFQVNQYTTGFQGGAAVAYLLTGNIVVTWSGQGQHDSGGVFGRLYNPSLGVFDNEQPVNSYTTGAQGESSLAPMVPSGDFVVAWTSQNQDGSGYGIFGARRDVSNLPWGPEFRVNSYTTGHQAIPSIASYGNANFVVVWRSDHLAGGAIMGQRYDGSGVAQGSEFRISTSPGVLSQPRVASDGTDFVVVWTTVTGYSGWEVFARHYDANGVAQTGEIRVNSYTTRRQGYPSIASHGAGQFVVVWESEGQGGDPYGIFGRRFGPGPPDFIFADGFE